MWHVEHDSDVLYNRNQTVAFMSIEHVNKGTLIYVTLFFVFENGQKTEKLQCRYCVCLILVRYPSFLNVKLFPSVILAPFSPKWQISRTGISYFKIACSPETEME